MKPRAAALVPFSPTMESKDWTIQATTIANRGVATRTRGSYWEREALAAALRSATYPSMARPMTNWIGSGRMEERLGRVEGGAPEEDNRAPSRPSCRLVFLGKGHGPFSSSGMWLPVTAPRPRRRRRRKPLSWNSTSSGCLAVLVFGLHCLARAGPQVDHHLRGQNVSDLSGCSVLILQRPPSSGFSRYWECGLNKSWTSFGPAQPASQVGPPHVKVNVFKNSIFVVCGVASCVSLFVWSPLPFDPGGLHLTQATVECSHLESDEEATVVNGQVWVHVLRRCQNFDFGPGQGFPEPPKLGGSVPHGGEMIIFEYHTLV